MQNNIEKTLSLYAVHFKEKNNHLAIPLNEAGIDSETIEEKTTRFYTLNIEAQNMAAALRAADTIGQQTIKNKIEVIGINFIADIHVEEKEWRTRENIASGGIGKMPTTLQPPEDTLGNASITTPKKI